MDLVKWNSYSEKTKFSRWFEASLYAVYTDLSTASSNELQFENVKYVASPQLAVYIQSHLSSERNIADVKFRKKHFCNGLQPKEVPST